MFKKCCKSVYAVLDKICEPIAVFCLGAVVVLTFGNAVLRYVFSAPLGWAEEISALLYTFMVFFGLSGTHKTGSAVGVDIIVSLLPQKGRKVFDIFSTTLTMILWVVMIILGAKLALITKSSATPYLLIPYHIIYWFIPISGFFNVVQLIYRLTTILNNTAYIKKDEAYDIS